MDWCRRVAVGVVCMAAALVHAGDGPARSTSGARPAAPTVHESRGGFDTATPQEADILRRIGAAEAQPDRVSRCLHTPDPPHTQWNQGAVAVLCHMQFDPVPTLAELRHKLDTEGPAALDRYFDGLRKAEAQPETAWELDFVADRRLGCACQEGRALADAWLAREPDGVWANLASGLQYAAAAQAARGTGYAQETSLAQFDRMGAMDARAVAPLKRALAKDPGLTPAIASLLWIEAHEGNKAVLAHLAAALRAHPGNYALHNTAGQLYQPKWFGTPATAEAELASVKAGSAKYPALMMVASEMELGRRACGKDCPWKRTDVDAVNAVGPYVFMFRKLVDFELQDGDYAEAAIYASQVLRFSTHPEWGMRTQRGVARRMLHDVAGARADAEVALAQSPGYQPAMELLESLSVARAGAASGGAVRGR